MPLATTFPVIFSFSNTADSSVNAQKHVSEPHSRLLWDAPRLTYLCQQTGHPLASPRSDSEDHPLCGKVPLKITKATQKDVRHPWFCGGTQWGRSQPRAALPWEATVLPAGGTFRGKQPCPKALGLWLCGWTSIHPPFQCYQLCRGSTEAKLSCLHRQNHDTKQSYHFHEFHSSKSTKGMRTGSCDPSKSFLKTPKPKDVFNSSNKKQSSWNSATISCFRLKIKLKKISQALNKQ